MNKKITIDSEPAMRQLAQAIGLNCRGGELIELVGDVGAGKTTFTKGLALGLAVTEPIQSPTFTINRRHQGDRGVGLAHYDFYRLSEAGIMADELTEVIKQSDTVTVIEWAGVVEADLPAERLRLEITPTSETERLVVMSGPTTMDYLMREVI